MAKRPTRRELAQQRQSFAGRRQELEDFQRNLALPFDNIKRKFIWMVSGEGGIGKSTLLRRYRDACKAQNYVTAYVDEYISSSILAVMASLAEQIADEGHSFEPFTKRYRTYQQHQKQIEADPDRPKGFSTVLGKASGRVLTETLKAMPGGGLVPALIGEEFIVEKGGELAAYIAQKIGNKDDVQLVLETVEKLTPLFVESLCNLAEKHPIVLFFDTYEQTALYLDKWLRDVLESKYGEPALEVLVVIAGRDELGQEWASENLYPLLEHIRLSPFTEEEAHEYLKGREIADPKAVELLLRLSGCVPVLLTTLVSNLPENLDELGDPTGHAIERFLKWVSDETKRQAVLTCALPRYLNLDIVATLFGTDQAESVFNFIKSMSFVSQRAGSGWVFHPIVREFMVRHCRLQSQRHWREIHNQLVNYHVAERDSLKLSLKDGLHDEHWQRHDLEWLYHTICTQGRGAEVVWINRVLDTFDGDSPNDYDRTLAETIREAGQALGESSIVTWGQECIDGYAANQAEDYEAALRFHNLLVETARLFSVDRLSIAYSMRAKQHHNLADHVAAIADFTRAIELQPENGGNYVLRGAVALAQQDYPAARADFTRAIELQPENGSDYVLRGAIAFMQQDNAAAWADFTRAIELQPEDGGNYVLRGAVALAQQDYPAARADFTRAIELQPEDGNNYYGRGMAALVQQDYPAARADFTRAIELQPEDGNNYYGRGMAAYKQQDYPAARADFTRAIELHPEDGNNYYRRGMAAYKQQDYPAARADFTRAIELHPNEGSYYYWRGRATYDQQDYPAARVDFTRAIKLQPGVGNDYYWRGLAILRLGQYTEAENDLARAVELEPDDAHSRFWLGIGQRLTDLSSESKDALEYTGSLAEKHNDLCIKQRVLAKVQLLNGDVDAAQSHYEAILRGACDQLSLYTERSYLELLTFLFPDREGIAILLRWFKTQLAKDNTGI